MFLRLVKLGIREGEEAAFTRFYLERAIPVLERADGCTFAGLLAPWRSESHESLTLWSSEDAALAVEKLGDYRELLRETARFLTTPADRALRLAPDPLATLGPPDESLPARGYRIEASEGAERLVRRGGATFVRCVFARVASGRLADFLAIYSEEVLPALRSQPGFRAVLLGESVEDPNGALSMSFWDHEEDAIRYEMSGTFSRLTARARDVLSPIYDWHLTLGGTGSRSPRPLEVSTYELVRGRRLDHGAP